MDVSEVVKPGLGPVHAPGYPSLLPAREDFNHATDRQRTTAGTL